MNRYIVAILLFFIIFITACSNDINSSKDVDTKLKKENVSFEVVNFNVRERDALFGKYHGRGTIVASNENENNSYVVLVSSKKTIGNVTEEEFKVEYVINGIGEIITNDSEKVSYEHEIIGYIPLENVHTNSFDIVNFKITDEYEENHVNYRGSGTIVSKDNIFKDKIVEVVIRATRNVDNSITKYELKRILVDGIGEIRTIDYLEKNIGKPNYDFEIIGYIEFETNFEDILFDVVNFNITESTIHSIAHFEGRGTILVKENKQLNNKTYYIPLKQLTSYSDNSTRQSLRGEVIVNGIGNIETYEIKEKPNYEFKILGYKEFINK